MEDTPSWDWTPREIALWNRVQKLECELQHARVIANIRQDDFVEEREIQLPAPLDTIQLPRVSAVEAYKAKNGMLAVTGWAGSLHNERISVSYYIDPNHVRHRETFANDVLPRLHMQFLNYLAERF